MFLSFVRAVWGGALLLAPDRALGFPSAPAREIRLVVRVLGVRQLAEAAVLAREHRKVPPRWPIAVDLLHAASMLVVAAVRPRLRREALRSVALAGALAGSSALARRR